MLPSWRRLQSLAASPPSIPAMFAGDPSRSASLSRVAALGSTEVLLDLSRQHVDAEVLGALLALAGEAGVASVRDAMFAGANVNATEARPALHVASRGAEGADAAAVGVAAAALDAALGFADSVRSGAERAADGSRYRAVVAVGIGGSDLGPRLVHGAFGDRALDCRFLSNVDPAAPAAALAGLDPRSTLVVACSKSFGTYETVANVRAVAGWLAAATGDPARQLVAVTERPDRAAGAAGVEFGRTFTMPAWIGGRFSVSSAAGLAAALSIGPDRFRGFLSGMRAVDAHFRTAPFEANLPVLLGLLTVWNRSFLGRETKAVVPYADALAGLVPWLQQVSMESNGKRTAAGGAPVRTETAPVVWGGVGTDAQHAFMQMLHQGTSVVPVDFIGVAGRGPGGDALFANLLAQASALAFGREGEPHVACPGDRPSTLLALSEWTPAALGALMALYEHATVVEGALWGVNSFDQFGVEMGKRIAGAVLEEIDGRSPRGGSDPATEAVLDWYLRHRGPAS